MVKIDVTIGARVDNSLTKEIDFLAKEEKTDKSAILRKILMHGIKEELTNLALDKYAKRQVSIGRAAEIAKIPLADFMVAASKRKIPINYSSLSLEEDFNAVKKRR